MSKPNEPVWTSELLEAPHAASDKARRVRSMFNAIAPRYEQVNRLFSGGRDAFWRRRAVALAGAGPDDEVLDIACGTGDFARAFVRAKVRSVTGCDFAHAMLVRARGGRDGDPRAASPWRPGDGATHWCECNALRLPFACERFSIVSCAFGVRNFQRLDEGLAEMHRVLRPGGRAVILEFTRPRGVVVRGLYEFYAHRLMPIAATLVSGDRSGAYRYLPRSVVSFLNADQMCERCMKAGFTRVGATPLTLGVVTVYVAVRE